MIEVKEGVRIIDETVLQLPSIKVPIEKALGRILRQEIVADSDFPPFDRVMMDGVAIRFEDFESGVRDFKIEGIQAAGEPQKVLSGKNCCLEVMTGAVAPSGADVIVPYEEVEIDTDKQMAAIQADRIQKGKNIHKQGSDKQAGDVLIKEWKKIGTPEIAVAASVGLSELRVTKNPSIAIISTGEELVDIHERPLPHQIRRSNVYAIAAELQKFGIKSELYHFSDEKDKLVRELEKILETHDVILTSGGVSKGKFDFIPDALESLGVKKLFHRIKQKPGKPFWFGTSEKKKVVFAFPGNPVSTFLCYHRYFVPWLKKSLGINKFGLKKAVLADDFAVKTNLTYYLQVESYIDQNGRVIAVPKVGRGSGDHSNLLLSDAFIELPGNTFNFKKGEVFNLISFRNS